ncbi:MAG: hypothetical protein IT260_14475 [Saprospiraceae bacterium]|nr:hypothetical protein [Saprospiraceae bacterium]
MISLTARFRACLDWMGAGTLFLQPVLPSLLFGYVPEQALVYEAVDCFPTRIFEKNDRLSAHAAGRRNFIVAETACQRAAVSAFTLVPNRFNIHNLKNG